MDEGRRVLLHLGYPKTGTTTLQDGLFGRHPEMLDLSGTREAAQLVTRVCHDPSGTFGRPFPSLDLTAAGKDGEDFSCVVLSAEALTNRNPPECGPGIPLATKFRRLRVVVGERFPRQRGGQVVLLLVVRQQPEIIISRIRHNYYTFTRDGGFDTYRAYLEHALQRPREGYLGTLFYHSVLQSLASVFEDVRLSVLPFDLLKTDHESFARRVAQAAGVNSDIAVDCLATSAGAKRSPKSEDGYVRPNPVLRVAQWVNRVLLPESFHPYQHGWGRGLNLFLHRLTEWSPWIEDPYVALTDEEKARIADIYRDDNRALAQDWELPLEAYGWPI